MELMGLKPVIDQATHERGNQLDQIFTNLEVQGSGVYFLEGSDHAMLAAEVCVLPASKGQLPVVLVINVERTLTFMINVVKNER